MSRSILLLLSLTVGYIGLLTEFSFAEENIDYDETATEESTYVKEETGTKETEIEPQQYLTRRFILSFAEELFKKSEYEKALLEYMRYRFYFPNDTIIPDIEFKIALCNEKLGKYKAARELYEGLVRRLKQEHNLYDDAEYRYYLSFYLENKYEDLYTRLDALKKRSNNLKTGLEYLYALSLFDEGLFSEAESILVSVSKGNSFLQPSINYLLSRTRQTKFLPQKDPYLAGILSTFIPGLGQAYIGRWGDAFYSFFGAVGGIGSGIYFWKKDRTFAVLSLSFGTLLYLGNIYGATVSAHLFNKTTLKEFISGTKREIPHKPAEIYTGN